MFLFAFHHCCCWNCSQAGLAELIQVVVQASVSCCQSIEATRCAPVLQALDDAHASTLAAITTLFDEYSKSFTQALRLVDMTAALMVYGRLVKLLPEVPAAAAFAPSEALQDAGTEATVVIEEQAPVVKQPKKKSLSKTVRAALPPPAEPIPAAVQITAPISMDPECMEVSSQADLHAFDDTNHIIAELQKALAQRDEQLHDAMLKVCVEFPSKCGARLCYCANTCIFARSD